MPLPLTPRGAAALAFLSLALAAPIRAQVVFGDVGFTVQSSLGTAGDVCWGFDCTPRPLAAASGDTLLFTLRAPQGAPFVIAAAAQAGLCQRIPGLWHELVLTPPLLPLFAGVISQPSNTRFCYDGIEVLGVVLPPLPPGTQLAVQAAAVVGTPLQPSVGWAFASAVEVTAR